MNVISRKLAHGLCRRLCHHSPSPGLLWFGVCTEGDSGLPLCREESSHTGFQWETSLQCRQGQRAGGRDVRSQHRARDPKEPPHQSLPSPGDTQDQPLGCRQSQYLHSGKTKEEEPATAGVQSHKASDVGPRSVSVRVKQEDSMRFQYLQFRDPDDRGN